MDVAKIELELLGTPGADFANARHAVIPPPFAPARWQAGINRLLERFPFETNIFCMTRFPKSEDDVKSDPVSGVIEVVRSACKEHGLDLHLATDRQIEDDLLGNVGAYMWACQYGIGLLETRPQEVDDLNDNVLIELGSMLITGRRCALLKDKDAPRPPTDLSGQIYKSVDFDDRAAVDSVVHRWIAEDLNLGPCRSCEHDEQ